MENGESSPARMACYMPAEFFTYPTGKITGYCRSRPSDGGDDPLNHAVDRVPVGVPVPDENDIVIGIDPDDIAAVTHSGKARMRAARPLFTLCVQPPEIAVIG